MDKLEDFIKHNWLVLLVALIVAVFVWIYILPQMDETLVDNNREQLENVVEEQVSEQPHVEITVMDQTDLGLDMRSVDSLGSLADLYSLNSIDTKSTQIGVVEGTSENIATLAIEQFSPYIH